MLLITSVTCLIYCTVLLSAPPSERPARVPQMTDAERDERSGGEWISSTLHYLEFLAGTPWRKLHRAGQRSNPVRSHYLDVYRLLNNAWLATAQPCRCKRCEPGNLARALQLEADALALEDSIARSIPKKPIGRHVASLNFAKAVTR